MDAVIEILKGLDYKDRNRCNDLFIFPGAVCCEKSD